MLTNQLQSSIILMLVAAIVISPLNSFGRSKTKFPIIGEEILVEVMSHADGIELMLPPLRLGHSYKITRIGPGVYGAKKVVMVKGERFRDFFQTGPYTYSYYVQSVREDGEIIGTWYGRYVLSPPILQQQSMAIREGQIQGKRHYWNVPTTVRLDVCSGCHSWHQFPKWWPQTQARVKEVRQAHEGAGDVEAWCLTCHDGTGGKKVDSTHRREWYKVVLPVARTQNWDLPHLDEIGSELVGSPCTFCHDIHEGPNTVKQLLRRIEIEMLVTDHFQ